MRNLIAAALLVIAVGASAQGTPAPDFNLRTPSGQSYGLNDFNGRVVVIEFWAYWAGPVRAGARDRAALAAAWAGSGVVMLDIGVGENAAGADSFKAAAALAANEIILLDTDKSVFAAYGCQVMPTAVVLDKNGNISATIPDADASKVDAAIKVAMAR
jgi:peroxiredoxin